MGSSNESLNFENIIINTITAPSTHHSQLIIFSEFSHLYYLPIHATLLLISSSPSNFLLTLFMNVINKVKIDINYIDVNLNFAYEYKQS